jgi:putative transcriptional regulator
MDELSPEYPSLAGQLLLAMPGIGDPRFEQAVIAMCSHRPEGALGIGIGRTVPKLTLHDLFGQLDIAPGEAPDCPIHFGGPVEPQRGFVLHTTDWRGDDTIEVADNFAFTSTLDILRAIARGDGPLRWLVALGYAGWGIRQLDDELKRHGWLQAPADDALMFETPTSDRWTRAFASQGIDARLLAPSSGRA